MDIELARRAWSGFMCGEIWRAVVSTVMNTGVQHNAGNLLAS
jgi:hypothetical protein